MRKVFFSFDYDDIFRVNVVRNCHAFASVAERQAVGFFDKAEREQLKRLDDASIKQWIRAQMSGSSVTVVLMGENTYTSRWVRFEIEESVREGKGLLGIRIHEIKDPNQRGNFLSRIFGEPEPPNMFDFFRVTVTVGENDQWEESTPRVADWQQPEQGMSSDIPRRARLSHFYRTCDWGQDEGRGNIAEWIESAAKKAGR